MIKKDIVNYISNEMNLSITKAKEIVDIFFENMKISLKEDGKVELRGFGIFYVRDKKRGMARNPRTNEEVPIKEGKTVKFKPGKSLQY